MGTATAAETTAATAAEVTTASAPHESPQPRGRPDHGAAAARSAELYERYGRTVTGLCRALLRDRAEAEDAAQQTFLSAHRAILNGTQPLEPAAWLATIARNECWARIRSRMREPLPADDLEPATSPENDPVNEAIRRADLAALWRAIEALPRQQRDALLLREFGGLSYEELAVALAVSHPAVESLLFRARSRLRTQLRAAYASLTGASWLELLARMLAGGAAPKVAALGVGAAAITGGAVVAPQLLESRAKPTPSPTQTVKRATTRPRVVAPLVLERAHGARVGSRAPVRASGHTPVRVRGRSGTDDATPTVQAREHESTTDGRGRGGGASGPGPSRTGPEEERAETTQTSSGRDGGSGHGGGDSAGSGRSGDGGSGGNDGGGGGDHSGHGGGDGGAPIATTPVVTAPAVTTPTATAPAAPTQTVTTDGD